MAGMVVKFLKVPDNQIDCCPTGQTNAAVNTMQLAQLASEVIVVPKPEGIST